MGRWTKPWLAEEIAVYAAQLRERRELYDARRLHKQIVEDGYGSNKFIQNLVVQMYGQCGHPEEARKIFDSLAIRNQYSWNIIIAAYAQNGQVEDAKSLFDSSPCRDDITWSTMLTGYAQSGNMREACQMFDKMPHGGTVTWTSMFIEYALAGKLVEARRMFAEMPHRDVICWNAIIAAFSHNGHLCHAAATFERMPLWTVASWNSMVTAHSLSGDVSGARLVFDSMPEQNIISWNAIVSAYALNGHVADAKRMFNAMPDKDDSSWYSIFSGYAQTGHLEDTKRIFDQMPRKTIVSWTTLVQACALCGDLTRALRVFDAMPQHDAVCWNALLQSYTARGDVVESRRLFDRMPYKNGVAWNLIIAAYAACGDGGGAMGAFRAMDLDGQSPDAMTYTSLFHAPLPLLFCRVAHQDAARRGFHRERSVCTGIIATYGKCGELEQAAALFEDMVDRDLLAWDAIITSYARNGRGSDATLMFQRMVLDGVEPDGVYFISLLSACSHGGLTEDGRRYFISMWGDYFISPLIDHYVCMVDLFGRSGRLFEAEELLVTMPFEAGLLAWRTLLHCCTLHGNKTLAQSAASVIESLDPRQSMPYVMLSHIARSKVAAK